MECSILFFWNTHPCFFQISCLPLFFEIFEVSHNQLLGDSPIPMTLLLPQIKCWNKNVNWDWVHAYNLSTQETETGRSQVQVILGYTARLCLKDGSGGGAGGVRWWRGGGGGGWKPAAEVLATQGWWSEFKSQNHVKVEGKNKLHKAVLWSLCVTERVCYFPPLHRHHTHTHRWLKWINRWRKQVPEPKEERDSTILKEWKTNL